MSGVHYDDAAVAEEFERTRYAYPEAIEVWCDRIEPWLEVGPGQRRVLDLGSGTGIWSEAIASRFDVEVVGVEPAAGMLGQAAATRSDPRVRFMGGTADALPLPDRSITSAWLSTVVHQFPDLAAAAAELRRVLVSGSPLMIRNSFVGRH